MHEERGAAASRAHDTNKRLREAEERVGRMAIAVDQHKKEAHIARKDLSVVKGRNHQLQAQVAALRRANEEVQRDRQTFEEYAGRLAKRARSTANVPLDERGGGDAEVVSDSDCDSSSSSSSDSSSSGADTG